MGLVRALVQGFQQGDRAEMVCRFKTFRRIAEQVHSHNTCVPDDPEEAAIHLQKRREAELLLSKDQDVSRFDDWHLPQELGPFSDGGDPCPRKRDYDFFKMMEEIVARRAVKDVAVE
jgi:curved DNA-binding protein CbpA